MAGTKQFGVAYPTATLPLDGTETLSVVQSGVMRDIETQDIADLAGGGTPGGADTQVQFNDAGAFGGDAGLVYNKTTNTLTVEDVTTTGLMLTAASSTGSAGLNLPHGTAPTSPNNGDTWTTTAGLFVRINGATVGPLAPAGSVSDGDKGDITVSSSGAVWTIDNGVVTKAKMDTAARTQSIIVACSDETTALTTGTAKVTFRMPYAFTLTEVRASVTTAPTGSVLTVDINEGGSTILSTKITIDAGEKTSTTAAAPPVISDSSLADDAEMTIDIDTVGSTIAGAGLKVALIGYPT